MRVGNNERRVGKDGNERWRMEDGGWRMEDVDGGCG